MYSKSKKKHQKVPRLNKNLIHIVRPPPSWDYSLFEINNIHIKGNKFIYNYATNIEPTHPTISSFCLGPCKKC